jgi:hypothetical protein
MAKTQRSKPKKPYPSFPLTPHPNGQWCKKIRGRVHFFGVWVDPEAALQQYHSLAADLHAGRTPSTSTLSHAGPTVKDACNSFLGWQKDKLDTGEIGARWFEDCRKILRELAKAVGQELEDKDAQIAALSQRVDQKDAELAAVNTRLAQLEALVKELAQK